MSKKSPVASLNDKEVAAFVAISKCCNGLSEESLTRILKWFESKYHLDLYSRVNRLNTDALGKLMDIQKASRKIPECECDSCKLSRKMEDPCQPNSQKK